MRKLGRRTLFPGFIWIISRHRPKLGRKVLTSPFHERLGEVHNDQDKTAAFSSSLELQFSLNHEGPDDDVDRREKMDTHAEELRQHRVLRQLRLP